MDTLLNEFTAAFDGALDVGTITIRLVAAMILGGFVGLQRERAGKPAGLRTHMLVSLGAALFVIVPAQLGMPADALSRIIQGVAAGVGFIGGGAILKIAAEREIEGLTTAAGIWLTAAIGVVVALGGLSVALVAILAAWIVLGVVGRYEKALVGRDTRGHHS